MDGELSERCALARAVDAILRRRGRRSPFDDPRRVGLAEDGARPRPSPRFLQERIGHDLVSTHAVLPTPSRDRAISCECPGVTCLFMRPQIGKVRAPVQVLEHLDHRSDSHNQRSAEGSQLVSQFGDAGAHENILPV